MNEIIRSIESAQLRTDIPEFRVGDTVRVFVKVVEGSRERLQAFEGVVIARSLTDASKDPVAESQFVAPLFKRHDPKRGWREAGKVCYPLDAALPDGDGPWFPQAEIICTPVSPAPTHKVPEGLSLIHI